MKLGLRAVRQGTAGLLLGAVCFAGVPARMLGQIASQQAASATKELLDQAHGLEVRGRTDMAAQKWKQVLLVDPNNTEALAGLARDAKLRNDQNEMNRYLDKLKSINPTDPNIARVQEMGTQLQQTAQLQQAGKYAEAGQYAQAMAIYRQSFGNNPPPGDWALAYYETEAATEDGRPHAIAGLRLMMDKYPADSRYQIALGRILTYNPNTRAEGRRLLERHPSDPQAQEALRQSLTWDAQNPAAASDIRSYLTKHNDAQLQTALKNMPRASSGTTRSSGGTTRTAPVSTPVSPEQAAEQAAQRHRTAEEAAAYAALNAKHIAEAEQRFKVLLDKEPDNPRALAGMGYVRMNQQNFGGAISFLEQAKQDGSTDKGVDSVLSAARFYYTMAEATTALNENDLPTAEQQFQTALNMNRPVADQTSALKGLGGTLLKAQQPSSALPVFERFVKLKPSDPDAWSGLFLSQYGTGQAAAALATERRMPAAVHAVLMKDPIFLRTLASAYSATGQDAAAQRILRSALDLPFPAGAAGLKSETQMQYADLLQQANHLDQALGLYQQVVQTDPSNANAWEGVVRIEHANAQDQQAVATLQAMPPSVYQTTMRDPGFEATVASVYDTLGRHDVAQQVLDNAVAQAESTGQKPSTALEAQRAQVYLEQNHPEIAYPIYKKILTEDPTRVDVWKGFLTSLHTANLDREALAQIQQIPQPVRLQLEKDPSYLQTVSGIYSGLNQPQQAMFYLSLVQRHYAQQHSLPPADIDIQDAWLLYNGNNDAGLWRQLMALGDRDDLTEPQRRTVQTIWANWSVRRAKQYTAANKPQLAIATLNAAAKTFPDNPGVIRALATGYANAGEPKQAVAIFKTQDMTSATASDYKAAVGAALMAQDNKDAETWLRFGLDQYPRDGEMLLLGAKFEKARGNVGRAEDYYRASLAAMPPADPGAELASELSQPVPGGEIRLPSTTQSLGLAQLLAPGATDLAGGAAPAPQAAYLPGYGNQYGTAPVQLGAASPNAYNGTTQVVPSYMRNPAYQPTPMPTAPARSNVPTRLKDYVPQASVEQSTPSSLSTDLYQQQQIRRLTQQAQLSMDALPRPQLSANLDPNGVFYGPYVPYVAPGAQQQRAAYANLAGPPSVNLGLGRNQNLQQKPEATDVLPAVRLMPNATNAQAQTATQLGASQNYDVAPAQYSGQVTQPANLPAQQIQPNYQGPIRTGVTTSSQDLGAPPLQSGDSYGQQYPQPIRRQPVGRAPVRRRNLNSGAMPDANQPALVYPGVPAQITALPYPDLSQRFPLGVAPTDQQLVSKNVPPLNGFYDPRELLQPKQQLSQRDEAELELAQLEGSYSGWVGGTASGRYRSGTAGFDRLTDLEVPFEVSAMLGKSARVTFIPKAVFLDSGALDTTQFQNLTGTVPFLGTLPANATNPPVRQIATGVGGEIQFSTANFGIAAGYTPYQFLVSNWTGRMSLKLGHFMLFGNRDSVKDTQLSYAGLHDPGSASPVFSGNIWGGVMQSGGGIRFDLGDERSGLYVQGDGAALDGVHVIDNRKYEGTMGAYFRAKVWPGYGSLNIGANFFGEHYDHNERGMTYGQGGYFSPNVYFLASVPVTFNGYYKQDWHYVINGAVGIQTFKEDSALFFPLDTPIQTGLTCTPAQITSQTCGVLPVNSNTGLNYGINAEGSYRIADHWYAGAFLSGNNTNNYNTVAGGFFVRYLFKKQYPTETYPTGIFPVDGFRPLQVP